MSVDISLIEWLLLLCRWPGAGCRWPSLGGPALRLALPPSSLVCLGLAPVVTLVVVKGARYPGGPALWAGPASGGLLGLHKVSQSASCMTGFIAPGTLIQECAWQPSTAAWQSFGCCMMVLGRLRQSSRVSQRTQLSALPCRIAEAGDGARAASSACRSVGRPAPPPVAPVRAPLPVGPASAGRHGQG